jgi:hypothetical protein
VCRLPESPLIFAGGVWGGVFNSRCPLAPEIAKAFPLRGKAFTGQTAKNCGQTRCNLSNSRHTGHMENRPHRIVWIMLAALMVASWAAIIWVASEVTRTALETLQYIVDLAQMS